MSDHAARYPPANYPPAQPVADRTRSTGATLTAIGLALGVNLFTIVGVVVFGWPPGNVFVLFWVENIILGLFSVVKIASARAAGGSNAALAVFFCFHYGIFCLVHAVFTGLLAYQIGIRLTFGLFGLPVILIFIRYLVETVTVWFGPGRQRDRISPKQAMFQPYPRIIVLQIAVLVSFALNLQHTFGSHAFPGRDPAPDTLTTVIIAIGHALRPLAAGISPALLAPGVGYVVLLMAIRTLVDVITTFRAVSR